ncbi:uncharacterized protein LOC103998642 [Musa acuminata AAA Group]
MKPLNMVKVVRERWINIQMSCRVGMGFVPLNTHQAACKFGNGAHAGGRGFLSLSLSLKVNAVRPRGSADAGQRTSSSARSCHPSFGCRATTCFSSPIKGLEAPPRKLAKLQPHPPEELKGEEALAGMKMMRSHGKAPQRGGLSRALREQKARLYIIRRCVVMLLCWHD